jgi:hypothetical protein
MSAHRFSKSVFESTNHLPSSGQTKHKKQGHHKPLLLMALTVLLALGLPLAVVALDRMFAADKVVADHWSEGMVADNHWNSVALADAHWRDRMTADNHWNGVALADAHWRDRMTADNHWNGVALADAHWNSVALADTHWPIPVQSKSRV